MFVQLMSSFMVTAVGLAGVATALWQEHHQQAPPLSVSPSFSLFPSLSLFPQGQGHPQQGPSQLSIAPSLSQAGIPWVNPGAPAGPADAGPPWSGLWGLWNLSPAVVAVLAAALQSALWHSRRPREATLNLQASQSGAGTVSEAALPAEEGLRVRHGQSSMLLGT